MIQKQRKYLESFQSFRIELARLTTAPMDLRMFKCVTRYEANVPDMGRLAPKMLKDKTSFFKKIREGDCP